METESNSEFGGSPDASEEDEEEPQDRGLLASRLKHLNQNEVVKSKLSDTMGAVQDEDNGLTWEANSSRCSTSQASEASATSGVYSLENSYVGSPTEMDEGRFGHRRTSSSPNQEPSSPNQKRDPDSDYSVGQMQEKAEDVELDPANPKSWPHQVQPSKIKDYLVQITQEVVPLVPEEKDNALKKKGELPLEGTVRARIQLITAVLEERNKKIFRRVNKKDVPPPTPQPVIRRPREPKIFSRQGIFVPLRHVEREAPEKNQKKEPVRYHLKPVQTNISKAGASVPHHKVERRTRPSFLSETQNKASEKPPPVLPSLADKANELDAESYSRLEQARFAPPNREDKLEKKERHSLRPDREKAGNILDETQKLEGQHYLPVTTEATDISEESSSLPERTIAKSFPPPSVEPLPEPTNEPQNQSQSTVAVPSDSTAQKKQCPANILLAEHEHLEHPVLTETRDQDIEPRSSQPEINEAAVLHSAEESRKQDVSPYLPVVAESAPDQIELSRSVSKTEKQEMRQMEVEHAKQEEAGEQLARILQAEPQPQHLVCSGKEVEGRETEILLDVPPLASRTETQETQNYPPKAADEYSGPPQPTCLMGETEKMEEQPLPFSVAEEAGETDVTSSQQPECPEEADLRSDEENQIAPLESQHPDISLSSPESQREEHSTAIARPGSEPPVISEPVTAPPRSKRGKSSQLKEASSSPPAEAVDSSEQLPIISSAVTETVEKEETRPLTLITATPLLEEQPSSDLADKAEQMEKQDNPPCSLETPTLVLGTSLSSVPVQPADATDVETEQYSPTQAPSEVSVSVSREPDVAVERDIIQPDSLLRVESPSEASVPFQEAEKLENQVYPPTNTKLYSEEEDVTHPSRDEGQQEGNVSLNGTTPFELEHSAKFEARKQNIKENSSTLSQLEETIALHSVDEAEKKDMQSDRSILEPSRPDSLSPICVPEKHERVQSEAGQTAQHLSSTALQTESDILPSVNEIDGMQAHLPAAVQDVSKPACLTATQEDKDLPTGTVTLDSGSIGIPCTIIGAEEHDTSELESKHMAKQLIQPVTTELEPNYPKVSPSVSELGLDIAFPDPSTDCQPHMLVTPRSKGEYPVPSEKDREEIEPCSSVTPTSELKIPPAGAETQGSPSYSPDALNEVPEPTPIISAFLPVHVKDPEVSEESVRSSVPPSEQAPSEHLQSKQDLTPDLKAKIEESRFPFPEMPKTDPEELLSTTTFLIGETRDGALSSPMDTQIVPEESKSAPKDFALKAIKEMDLTSSTLPAEPFSKESISLHAVDGEKQDHSHSETKNLDIEPYCPVIAQLEQEDVTSLSREEIKKQEMPLCSFSTVQPELVDQGLLHDVRERDGQEKIPLETDISKEQNAPLRPPIQQQVPECLNLQQSETQLETKEIQPSSFAAVLYSSRLVTETENGICRDSLSKTAENDYEISVLAEFMNEARKQETQPLQHEAAQLECKQSIASAKEKEQITFPPVTVPLDQGHVGLVSSPEPQLSPPEVVNQASEQPPSASPLCPEKVEKQEVNPCSPADLSSAMGQLNSVLGQLIEETEQPQIQPYPPKVENVMPEEPLSIAAFLLSEAQEVQTSLPLTTEKDTRPPFEEAGLLVEKPGSAVLPEMNGTIKEEIQPLLTHFESRQLSSKPQAEVTDVEKREDISDVPTTPNFTVKQPSNTLLSEPINDTHTKNIPSAISSVDSDKIKDKKATVITAEDLSKTKDIPCLSRAEKTLQESENDLQKEKEFTCQEKVREESVSSPELDSSNTSEDYKVVSTHAPPFISLADEEENKHTPERLEYLETVSSLKTKPFHDVGDVIVTQESSVCNLHTNISEGLTEDIHENKANESQEMVGEMRVQRNVETEKQSSAWPGKKNDSALNVASRDYFERYTVIDDRSFTQTGKEQSVEVVQRLFDITKENLEEATALPASSKNTLNVSVLERDLGEDFHEMVKRDNTTAAKEETSKMLKEDRLIDAVKTNKKNKEDELNLAGAPLCSSEKNVVAHPPEIPVQDTAHNSELLEVPPALSFLYKDLYEEVMAEPKNDRGKHLSNKETENTDVLSHRSLDQVTNDGAGIHFEKDTPKDEISNNLEESQTEQVLKYQPIDEQVLSQTRVSQVREPHENKQEALYSLAEVHAESQVLLPGKIVTGQNDALLEGPTEIASDIKVTTCQPALAIPFGSRLYGSGASNDESSQTRGEDDLSAEAGHVLPEETSDEESCPILDYAATLYPEEESVQGESTDAACLTADQHQQSEVTEVHKVDQAAVTKPVEESAQLDETLHQIISLSENEEQLENHFGSVFTVQDARAFDHGHLTCWEAEETTEEGVDEDVCDLGTHHREATNQQYAMPEVKSDTAFGELDYSLLSHDFDTYPLYSIKEEEYSDIDEDLAELMDYEMVAHDDVFREETVSEVAREDDRKSLDHISNTYEFVDESEANTYAEDGEFELMGLEKFPRNVPESEDLQKEMEQAQFDAYCCQCKCLICADDKLLGDHKEHNVTNLDTAATELKSQLGGFLDVLQERSLKIEGFVSEIEALFNSLEENCKGKEQLLEEQNESIINAVIADHDEKRQSFEDAKNTKMEYLYEQMVNFQEYIDTAKETLETIVKETEEMDDFVFLRSISQILYGALPQALLWKERGDLKYALLLSAVENILILEKMPASFSQFEHFADTSAHGDQTFKHMPVPQTPKLQQQDPNSATSTSIAVYWTVNEEDVIDFFQVYCMEEYPGNKEQSGLVEEYRVTVKESNCILEDLEPGHCYSVWVMAVNYTGCSFPSNKSTFRTGQQQQNFRIRF
ncbi:hypothetical protein lerEdw1_000352 [Lerista edwardsae]|nr:hypothetical protein lerEdw1_000352 [Lerista edwardsae]